MLVNSNISALLASPAAGGTMAAVRNLGAAGIDVRIMSSKMFSAAAWSKYVSKTYSTARETDHTRFLADLVQIGAAEPGNLLLPTSDHTAWLYAENAAKLQTYFQIYQSQPVTMRRILDKKLMAEAAVKVGMPVLESWYPQTLEDIDSLAPSLPYPILIKPRTQLYRRSNNKGIVVNSPDELRYYAARQFKQEIEGTNAFLQESNIILQRFVSDASQVHSISGFLDRTGELFVTRHSAKVFQRSHPVGVGVCFESLATNPALAASVRQLCKELDYFGIFEVEFLWFDGSWNVIDFNPRLFSQVGMDVERGAPLPLLAYLDAIGKTEELRIAVEKAQAEPDNFKVAFYDRFTFAALLLAQSLTSRISPRDRAYWRSWKRRSNRVVDFAFDPDDRMPGIIHIISETYLGLMALPRFLRVSPEIPKTLTHLVSRSRA